MALNPPIQTNGEPQLIPTEGGFVVNGIEVEGDFTIESTRKKYSGRGRCKLSHLRIIYINDKNDAELSAFDLPLANIRDFKFNQPIFGANNLTGKCRPIGSDIPSDIHFKLKFMHGGETEFVRTFYGLHGKMQEKMRRQRQQPQRAVPPEQLGQQAVMDPSEAGVIYLPVDAQAPQMANSGMMPPPPQMANSGMMPPPPQTMMNTGQPVGQPMTTPPPPFYNSAPPPATGPPVYNPQPAVYQPGPQYPPPPQGYYPPPAGPNYGIPAPMKGGPADPNMNPNSQIPGPMKPGDMTPNQPPNYYTPPQSNHQIPGPPQKPGHPPAPAQYNTPNSNIPQPDKSAAPMPNYQYQPPQ